MSDSQPSQDSTATITESRSEVLYFAYGSNLSTEQMLQRCPSSVPIGLGFLSGWRWIINARGYANIIPSSQLSSPFWSTFPIKPLGDEEDGVYGLLHLLPSQDEDTLDVCEGVPWAYGKVVMEVERVGDENARKIEGQSVRALVYVDQERVQGDRPKEEYKGRVERGIEDAVESWGLEKGYSEGMRGWVEAVRS